jgi:hypothetical protein
MALKTARGIDFIAYDNHGEVVLLAEAKSRSGTSDHWAAQLRRNILAHGALPRARFFLIATPEQIYAWKQKGHENEEALPDFRLDAQKELLPYLEKLNRTASDLSPRAFEILVFSWLNDLASPRSPEPGQPSAPQWLIDSGFLDSLRNARIEQLAA